MIFKVDVKPYQNVIKHGINISYPFNYGITPDEIDIYHSLTEENQERFIFTKVLNNIVETKTNVAKYMNIYINGAHNKLWVDNYNVEQEYENYFKLKKVQILLNQMHTSINNMKLMYIRKHHKY